MDHVLEGLRRELVLHGMSPKRLGKLEGKRIEFVTTPWLAGREIFVLVQEPGKPKTLRCVGADEVEVLV